MGCWAIWAGVKLIAPVLGILHELDVRLFRHGLHHVRPGAGDRILVKVGIEVGGSPESAVVEQPLGIKHETFIRHEGPGEIIEGCHQLKNNLSRTRHVDGPRAVVHDAERLL